MTERGLLLLGLRTEEEEASSSRRLALAVKVAVRVNRGTRNKELNKGDLSGGLAPLVWLVPEWSLRLHCVGKR